MVANEKVLAISEWNKRLCELSSWNIAPTSTFCLNVALVMGPRRVSIPLIRLRVELVLSMENIRREYVIVGIYLIIGINKMLNDF